MSNQIQNSNVKNFLEFACLPQAGVSYFDIISSLAESREKFHLVPSATLILSPIDS